MKRILSFIAMLSIVFYGFGQKISITNVDNAGYPKINVSLTITEKGEAQQSDFKVYEKDKEVPFMLAKDNSAGGPSGRNICFLIEASGFTYGAAINQFKQAVSDVLGKIGENDKVNVCYFGKVNSDGKSLNVLSAEFTNDKSTLRNEINSKINALKDTNPVADVYKSIYECLDFYNSKQDLSGSKILIVLSAAINSSKSPIKAEDCIDKSTKFNIPIYTITYKTANKYAADNFIRLSDKTNGKSASAKNLGELNSAISDFMGAADNSATQATNAWILTFDATQSSETNNFDILFQGEKVSGTYTLPEGQQSFISKYWMLFLIGGIVVLAIIIIVVLLMMKSRKAKAEEARKTKELEERNILLQQQMRDNANRQTMSAPVQEPQKMDLKKTMIGGGGGAPTVMVSAGSFQKNFTLSKMRMTIGRNAGNDIMIPETTVSGNHADLVNESGNWYIIDANSTNGVLVNGTKVSKQRLNNGDMIKLGAATLKVQF
jgi:hypothetical protein